MDFTQFDVIFAGETALTPERQPFGEKTELDIRAIPQDVHARHHRERFTQVTNRVAVARYAQHDWRRSKFERAALLEFGASCETKTQEDRERGNTLRSCSPLVFAFWNQRGRVLQTPCTGNKRRSCVRTGSIT